MVMAEYLTVRQAAALLGVDHKTIRREIASGRLPALRIGRIIRINRATLDTDLAYTADPLAPRRLPRQPPDQNTRHFMQLEHSVELRSQSTTGGE
jgi:excisionase family DNA binding protein